jgi:transposase
MRGASPRMTGIGGHTALFRNLLDMRWRTSPVEGQISRLKMIKQTMYGRAL